MLLKGLMAAALSMIAFDAVYSAAWFSVVEENRSWTYAPGWRDLKDATQNEGLPTENDDVDLNNKYLIPETPFLITNGVNVNVRALRLATIEGVGANYVTDGRILALKMEEGSFVHTSAGSDKLVVGYATNGYGNLVLTGGMISNQYFTVGYRGQGVVTNNGGTLSLGWTSWTEDGEVKYSQNEYLGTNIGQGPSSTGRLYQVSGTLSTPLHVGVRGYGEFYFLGGKVVNRDVRIGDDVTGRGYMCVNSENGDRMGAKSLYVGFNGTGTMDVKTSAWCEYLKVGGNMDVETSAVNVEDGAVLTVKETCYVGGYRGWQNLDKSVVVNMKGRGEICLKGGEVKFENKDGVPVRLFVNGMTNENPLVEGYGKLCGYGKVQYVPSDDNNQKIRMMMNGVVEANGYGTEGELFLGHIASTETALDAPFDWTTTNGWYAVNKGILTYPRTWVGTETGNKTFLFGNRYLATDTADETTNKLALVNNILVTTRGGNSGEDNRTWFCSLYASDCDVIPAGLPADKKYVGIWSFNMYRDCGEYLERDNANGSFSSMDITFRYDHTKVTERDNLFFYKYTNEFGDWKWVRLGKYKAADLQDRPLISVMNQPRLANATTKDGAEWNANGGWYAIFAAPDNGTVFILR